MRVTGGGAVTHCNVETAVRAGFSPSLWQICAMVCPVQMALGNMSIVKVGHLCQDARVRDSGPWTYCVFVSWYLFGIFWLLSDI